MSKLRPSTNSPDGDISTFSGGDQRKNGFSYMNSL
jgi:hypothetical protein